MFLISFKEIKSVVKSEKKYITLIIKYISKTFSSIEKIFVFFNSFNYI